MNLEQPENWRDIAGTIPIHETFNTSSNRYWYERKKTFPDIQSGTLLDAGCSFGATTGDLAEYYPGCKVIGMDLKPGRLPEGLKINQPLCKDIPKEFTERISFRVGNFYFLDDHIERESLKGIFAINNFLLVAWKCSEEQHLVLGQQFHHALENGGYLCMAANRWIENKYNQIHVLLQKHTEGFSLAYPSDQFFDHAAVGPMAEAYGISCRP